MQLKQLITFFFVLLITNVFAQEERHYKGWLVNATYHVKNGMLNGEYISYYISGKKKAEGSFKDNQRVGKWVVYDATGIIKAERIYKNGFVFTSIIPPYKSDSVYSFSRDSNGCYNLYRPTEQEIRYDDRIWMRLLNADIPYIGENKKLFNVLYANMLRRNIVGYKYDAKDIDTRFDERLDTGAWTDTSKYKVVGFLTKNDWYYSSRLRRMDCYIIGICPLVVMKGTIDTVGLFWVYYPKVRKYLAQEKVKTDSPLIQNMDDVLFCMYCTPSIEYEASRVGSFKKVQDSWNTIMMIINLEHDAWLY